MRRLALPATAAWLLFAATTAFAGAGLPKIATVQAGPYDAVLSNDSKGARTGSNVFTLEIPEFAGDKVSLRLTGPAGQIVVVPLKPLVVLGGGGHGEGETHAMPEPDSHGKAADAHEKETGSHGSGSSGEANSSGGDAHGDSPPENGYLARGKVRLNATGTWTAQLEVTDAQGASTAVEFPLQVKQGGPNTLYVSFSGLLMGGTVVYGWIQRRRQGR